MATKHCEYGRRHIGLLIQLVGWQLGRVRKRLKGQEPRTPMPDEVPDDNASVAGEEDPGAALDSSGVVPP